MRTIPERFTYPRREFNVVGFEINPTEDRGIIDQALMEVRGHGADRRDTAGKIRTDEQLLNRRYLGAQAENLLVEYLQAQLGSGVKVDKEPFESYAQHVDIVISWSGGEMTLEVRSSFYYATYLRNVIGRHFKTLGPYSTARKPGETVKDFYLQTVLRQSFNINETHTICFTGGAPGHWFTERGVVDSLEQDGAEYLVIPMLEGMDTTGIVNEIRGAISGV